MCELIVISGCETGRRVLVDSSKAVSIGRDSKCAFQLRDPAVSRLHCHVLRENETLMIRDAESRWGTFVNGSRVHESKIRVGDRVLVGETEFLVSDEAHQATTVFPTRDETRAPRRAAASNPTPPRSSADRIGSNDDVMKLLNSSFLNYDVNSIIATARTGAVFQAFDRDQKQSVALKVFWPHVFGEGKGRARFERAMASAISIRHENIVRVLSAGRKRGVCYTASEVVAGESVAQLISRIGVCGMLDWRRVCRIAIDVAKALEAAAEHKIVHRNITPSNLLIRSRDDLVKLNDLVLAKAIAETTVERITAPGELLGDLVYMSPEQLSEGRPIDHRSDIYNLGAALYAMLTARPPLEGRNIRETIQLIEVERPEPPTTYHLSISPLFEGEVMRMLEKRPEDRHSSPAVLLKDLRRVAKYENIEELPS